MICFSCNGTKLRIYIRKIVPKEEGYQEEIPGYIVLKGCYFIDIFNAPNITHT